MKKIFLFLLIFLLMGCVSPKEETLEDVLGKITLNTSISSDLELPLSYRVNGKEATATWTSSNPSVLTHDGIITKGTEDVDVTLTLTLSLNDKKVEKDFNLTVESISLLSEFIETIQLPESTSTNLNLAATYRFNNEDITALWQSSNTSILSNTGEISPDLENHDVVLELALYSGSDYAEKAFAITIEALPKDQFLDELLGKINLAEETKTAISLPRNVYNKSTAYAVTWSSNNEEALSSTGRVGLIANDTVVTLTASISTGGVTRTKAFIVKAVAKTIDEQSDHVFNLVSIPTRTAINLVLPTEFDFGLTGIWTSSNTDALSSEGTIQPTLSKQTTVTLTLRLSNQKERTYEVTISINSHLILDRTFSGTKENVVIAHQKLELAADAAEGVYTTEEIETLPFSSAVASWAATSSKDATVELFIRVRVGSTWSKYFSYGQWGLGNKNALYNQSDTVAKLSTDEVIIQSGKTAEALQIKVVLKRTTTTTESPKLSLIATALQIPGYAYPVDITSLPQKVDHDVPMLNQNIVPGIGNVICSPTSSTMLLKYRGHNFADKGTYEHEYIAGLLKDHGDFNAYGNWVYNTVGMSAFGETSYVKRFYSYQEMLQNLHEVGPMAASIRGSVVVEKGKNYTTNGHLIVVRGYRFDGDQLYIIVNDPNLSNVHDEMKIENFLNVWRNVNYIIE